MYGIDISHYQNQENVPYDEADFVIVKASEATFADPAVHVHVEKVRAAGKVLGLYHLYRHGVPYDKQIQTFLRVAQAVELGVGDLFPALDVEANKWGGLPNNAWNHPCEAMCVAFEENYGGSLVYCNIRDFHLLGSPKWILERNLWHAQYSNEMHAPKDPAIWQCRSDAFEYGAEGSANKPNTGIDQDRILVPIETLQIQGQDEDPVTDLVALTEKREILEKISNKKA